MGTFQSIKFKVVEKIKKILPLSGLEDTNITISSIHTHSGPGGDSWRLLYNFTTYGFDPESFARVVDGIVTAITHAHHAIKPNCKV